MNVNCWHCYNKHKEEILCFAQADCQWQNQISLAEPRASERAQLRMAERGREEPREEAGAGEEKSR